ARNRRGARPVVQLARVELLAVPREGDVPFARDAVELVEASEVRPRESKDRAVHVVEAVEPGSGERVRVRCTDALKVALQLIAARLLAHRAARPPTDELVRVYHLAKSQYVRDPRTGCRAMRPRDVLDGALDPFLLAYLTQRNAGATTPTPETASVPAASDE
ncbi:MAG TPA: hypothetical protein VGS80_08260, partial [Ktedonobacterales bacterium]|nr:hypothetical protein [Ktedonobacterales bacterium]